MIVLPYLPHHLWDYIRKLEHKSKLKYSLSKIEQLKQAKRERDIIELTIDYIQHYLEIKNWNGEEWETQRNISIRRIEFLLNENWYMVKIWKAPKWCESDTNSEYYRRLYEKCGK